MATLDDRNADIQQAVSSLLKTRGVPEVIGPSNAIFWAGNHWVEYMTLANGLIKPRNAPRVRPDFPDVDTAITNCVRTIGLLCDRYAVLWAHSAVVWRLRPQIEAGDYDKLYWHARLAFVPMEDMADGIAAEPPELEETNAVQFGLKESAKKSFSIAAAQAFNVMDARADLHALFAAATITELQPPCGLAKSSIAAAAKIVGDDGTLICCGNVFYVVGFPNLKIKNFAPAILGSEDAWALLSADGKKAVIGMR